MIIDSLAYVLLVKGVQKQNLITIALIAETAGAHNVDVPIGDAHTGSHYTLGWTGLGGGVNLPVRSAGAGQGYQIRREPRRHTGAELITGEPACQPGPGYCPINWTHVLYMAGH